MSNAQINSIRGTISTAQSHAKAHVKMSLVFRNALMPSENQQVLRLRLAYLMPKIIKRVGENSLETSSPNYFWNIDRPWCFKGAVLHILADNGDIYLVNGDSDSKEWNAYRHVSPAVEDKTDFWLMHMACVPTGEISKTFKTKKALITALEEGTAEFHKDERKYYEDNYRSFKLRKKQQGKSSPYDLIKDTDTLTDENMLEFGRQMIAGAGTRRAPTYQDPKTVQSSGAATEKDILELGRQMKRK